MVLGTTGEGVLLRSAERRRVAEVACQAAEGLAVMVHCGAQTTEETCELAAHAAQTGADAVTVIAPSYFALTKDEQIEHFAAAARACAPLPFYIYEYSDRSGYAVSASAVQEVHARVDNLVGMKVSDAPFDRVEPYLNLGLDVFIGAEGLIGQGLDRGAVGAVSGVAAAFPEAVSALVSSRNEGDGELVNALRVALSGHPFQAAVKSALTWRGVPVGRDVRAPLLALSEAAAEGLYAELGQLVDIGALAPAGAAPPGPYS